MASQKYSHRFVFCRLLVFAEWIRGRDRGRDREWITLPLNKQGKKKKKRRGEDVCFRKSQDRTREACFLYPLFKQPYSCCNSSSILVHSRGFNLHSGPVIRFANQFLSPLCGPLSVLLYSIKLVRMGSLVLLICILNPREARNHSRMKAKETGILQGIRTILMYFYTIHVYIAAIWHLVTKMQYSFSTTFLDGSI